MEKIPRRGLLAGSAAFTFLSSSVLGRGGATAPSDKLNIGFIGVGGLYGSRGIQELVTQNIVALCDVDWRASTKVGDRLSAVEVAKKYPGAKRFDDWRIMLQEMDKSLDAVLVSSADHTHAHASIIAMKMGKHVLCEKPLAHSIHEVRSMMAAARNYKAVTQMGLQGHASEDLRSMVEWIRDGAIGDVTEVHLFEGARLPGSPPPGAVFNLAYPFEPAYYEQVKHVREEVPVPAEVKWDLFLGPAPRRPFHPMYIPLAWRSWLDFGTGLLGDHGSHFLDPVHWALDLGFPETIEAETDAEYSGERSAQLFPRSSTVRYAFPARGKRRALTLVWHQNNMPPVPKDWKKGEEFPTGGGMFLGTKGALVFGAIYSGKPKEQVSGLVWLVPDQLEKSYRRPAKTLPRPESNWLEWVEAVRNRKPASADFDYSGMITEICLLGSIAIRHKGRILRFDAEAQKFSNSDTANQMFQRPYREGWALQV
jgi:predicted dehydrogenase